MSSLRGPRLSFGLRDVNRPEDRQLADSAPLERTQHPRWSLRTRGCWSWKRRRRLRRSWSVWGAGPAAFLHPVSAARLHLCIRRLCSNPMDTDRVEGGALYPSPPLHFPAPPPPPPPAPSLSSPHPPRRLGALRRARRSEVRGPPWPPVPRTALSRRPASH